MDRRKFLRLFGVAAAVAPIAAVAVPDISRVLAKTGAMSSEDMLKFAYIEKMVNPPLMVDLSNDFPVTVPGGITYVESWRGVPIRRFT